MSNDSSLPVKVSRPRLPSLLLPSQTFSLHQPLNSPTSIPSLTDVEGRLFAGQSLGH